MRQIPSQSDIPLHGWAPYSAMHLERIRAHAKHGTGPIGSMEAVPWDSERWLPVLTEETGEVARAINEYHLKNVNRTTTRIQLVKELVQVGAMVAAWIDALCDEGA